MYVGIDVGGTKTLIAVLNYDGDIEEKIKIPTNKDYSEFLNDLKEVKSQLKTGEFAAGAIGIPVTLMDRRHDRALKFSNLPWQNVSITHDIERVFHCPFVSENDAKLAALSEALLLKNKYSSVLYVTVSTGIGFGFVKDGKIDVNVGDGGGRTLLLQYKDHAKPWEDFAGGRAIYEKYGKMAKDLNDESAWKAISRNLAKGFIHLIALMEPEVIVVGGGVGRHFSKYSKFLKEDIEKYKIPLINMPKIVEAKRPEDAVIYGCYDIARQYYPHARVNQKA